MNPYGERALDGASGMELTIALYDGVIRFMRDAIAAVERGDIRGRRRAVKRAMHIVLYLQGTLNVDIGGKPAEALSEFYISIFALMLQGSQANSKAKFEEAIGNVWKVREAWRQAACSGREDMEGLSLSGAGQTPLHGSNSVGVESSSNHWSV
jgi:flagellar secretion chaperone FliS